MKPQKLLLLLQEHIALTASCTFVLGPDIRTRTGEPAIVGLTLNSLCHRWMSTFLCFTCWLLLTSSLLSSSFLLFFLSSFLCFYIAGHFFSLCLSPLSFFFSFMSSCSCFLRYFSSSALKHSRLVSTCAQPDGFGWGGRGGRSKLKKVVHAYFGFCFTMRGSAVLKDFSVPSEGSAIGCIAGQLLCHNLPSVAF